MGKTSGVVIGMDPHKRTATIVAMSPAEAVVSRGRFATDVAGFEAMLAVAAAWPERVWAVEGCEGIGKHVALRLLDHGEAVAGVPAKLSARMRGYATGQGRKTDDTDAHSVALVGVRMAGLREVVNDQTLKVLRLLADRRRRIGEDHTRMVCQLHRVLLELLPGGAKRDLSAAQARRLLAAVRPADPAAKTRKRVAMELVADLERVYARKNAANKELVELVRQTGTGLLALHGIGPSGAARLLVEVGDITRFRPRATSRPGRHRAHRRVLRRQRPPPALPRRQPADQHDAAHDGRRSAAYQDHARSRLLRPEGRCREDPEPGHALPEEATVGHRVPHHAGRRHRRQRHQARDGPGRTPGRVANIQRGRLTAPHRHFGSVTSRTRHHQGYDPLLDRVLTQKGARCVRSPNQHRVHTDGTFRCPVCGSAELAAPPYESWPPPPAMELTPPYEDLLGSPSYEVSQLRI
jgi:transposase